MTEVVRSNFSHLYPQIEEKISLCDFVAIDTEFTGLTATPEDKRSFFDSLEERYCKLRRFAQTYFICQFGLSVFTKDKNSDANRYVVHTFTFYIFPRPGPTEAHVKVGIQASNAKFLCDYNFDFNKLFYEGITYINREQEEQLLASVTDDQIIKDALGFTRVFRLLLSAQKPLVGHNLLGDLMLMYEKFHQPLPEHYHEFKLEVHRLFPTVIDTKHVCYAVQKQLSRTNLVEFSSLVDLYEALGSQKGTYYVLCAPSIVHADPNVAERYAAQKLFHEAGFDAYCAGFVFLRIAHLLAMKGVESSSARPVHTRQYFRLMQPYSNRVNMIQGPIHYINLDGVDSTQSVSDWLIVCGRNNDRLTPQKVQEYLDWASMEVRMVSPSKAVVVLSSKKRAEQLLSQENESVSVRKFRWITDSRTGNFILWFVNTLYRKLVIPGMGIGLLGMGIGLLTMYLTTW